MDTKSRNIRYSMAMKAVAVLIIWISLAGLFASVYYYGRFGGMLGTDDFRNTPAFLNEFRKYTDNATDYAVRLRNEAYIKEGKTVTGDVSLNMAEIQIEESKPDDAKISVSVSADNSEASLNAKDDYIDNELQRFRDLGKQLSAAAKNYGYVVVDSSTGQFVTNMYIGSEELQEKIDRIKKQPFNIFISKDKREASYVEYSGYFNDMRESFRGTSYEMYAAAFEPFEKGGPFYESWLTYINMRELIPVFIVIASLSFVLGITAFIYLIAVAGRRGKGGQVIPGIIDRIYTDVQALLVILAAGISLGLVRSINFNGDYLSASVVLFILLSVDMFIGLAFILSIVRHIKNRALFRHTLIYAIGKGLAGFVRRCMGAKTFKISVLLLLLAYGLLNGIFFAVLVASHSGAGLFAFVLWVGLNIAAVYFASKSLISLSDIMKWVSRISSGSLEEFPAMKDIAPAFSGFAGDVANIQSGLKNAVAEAVKGERLKAELITNVSHDLKTPLTSIINYVDLLKNEETDNDNIKQYTGVLVEKSNRLKQLIDDLMEASKAASGNISVNMESIEMHSLVLQAAAEFAEKASDAGLDIRIKPVEQPVHVCADGKLMWRIMENLFSNAVKYSQRSSRVYLEVESLGCFGVITVKNMSEMPLDIPADQLMERFVRGDRSRTTEGSGLGLAIARNLAEVQGGSLGISIDGDLFKVSVKIPLESR